MNKFKVGDRVATYAGNSCGDDLRCKGTVVSIHEENPDVVEVIYDDMPETTDYYHYKQCRKLVKKKKQYYQIEVNQPLLDGGSSQYQVYLGPLNAGVYTLTINAEMKKV